MSYTIDRLEHSLDRNGKDEIFVSIMINDELGTYPFARWLSQNEYSIYMSDNSKINEIMDKYLITAKDLKLRQMEYIKNPPKLPTL